MNTLKDLAGRLWWKIQTEPVVVTNAVTAVIAAGVSLGLYSADKSAQLASLVGAVIVSVGTLFARRRVTPVVKQNDLLDDEGYVAEGLNPAEG
jgi:malonyl CoA-acyl carrier protein transacylase